jgi:hypothetical protein
MTTEVTDAKYKVGQVWSYKARSQEPASTFTVVRVEADSKLGTIVHISLQGLKIRNSLNKDGYSETIAHMPFAEKAIDASVTRLLQENAKLPDYEGGYDEWRGAFDKQKAGIFSITVAEAVDVMESALSKPK